MEANLLQWKILDDYHNYIIVPKNDADMLLFIMFNRNCSETQLRNTKDSKLCRLHNKLTDPVCFDLNSPVFFYRGT